MFGINDPSLRQFSGYSGYSGQSGYSGYSGSGLSGYSGYCGLSGYSGFCGLSGYSGYSGSGLSGYSGFSGNSTSGYSGYCGLSGYSGYSGSGLSGYSGFSGNSTSGYSGYCGLSGYSGFCGLSGYSGYSGSGLSGYSGYSGNSTSGYSGYCGLSGYSGFCGLSGYSGYSGSGVSGYSGYSGNSTSGYSGYCGLSGYSGYCGLSGYSGYSGSGLSGYSGFSGNSTSGYSGYCGLSGYSGFCGLSGYSGYSGSGVSGYSGYSGSGLSGYSGFCGLSGYSGYCGLSGYSGYSGSGVSGYSGYSGTGLSGYSGYCGLSGYSGFCGLSGYSGYSGSGISGYSGYSGNSTSGYSGYCGLSGYSGFCGLSGYSGYSGSGISGYSGYSGVGLSGYSGYSGLGGPMLSTNVARVDVSGNDGTGIVGDLSKPFRTTQGAITAIEAGTPGNEFWVVDIGTYFDGGTVTVTSIRKLAILSSNASEIENWAFDSLTHSFPNASLGIELHLGNIGCGDIIYNGTADGVHEFYVELQTAYCGNVTSSTTPLRVDAAFIDGAAQGTISAPGFGITLENLISTLNHSTIDSVGSTVTIHNSRIQDVVHATVVNYDANSFRTGTNINNVTETYAVGNRTLPAAGTTGQILAKTTNTNFDVEWINDSIYSEIARVDPSGNDTTGVVGNLNKPFLTMQGAVNALQTASAAFPVIEFGANGGVAYNEDLIVSSLTYIVFKGTNKEYDVAFNSLTFENSGADISTTITIENCTSGDIIRNAGTGFSTLVVIANNGYINGDITNTVGVIQIRGYQSGSLQGTLSCPGYDITVSGFNNIDQVTVNIDSAGSDVIAINTLIDTISAAHNITLEDSRILNSVSITGSIVYDDSLLKGLIPGGTTGQFLAKASNNDFDNVWITGGSSGYSGYCGLSGYSGFCGLSGYSGFSGNSTSGYSGYCGLSGYSGFCGLSGYSGYSGSGVSGYSGYSGNSTSGYSGYCGLSGYSGFCGLSGYSGYSGSGVSGYSGYSGNSTSGYSGYCGLSGYSGFCGLSGYSGYSGSGLSGYSGYSGNSTSGYSGYCGLSGYSGFCGLSGYSGYSGSGLSGYSGYCGLSGYSGYSGSGLSGYSGYSGPSLLVFSTQTDTDYTLALGDLNTGVNMSSSSTHVLTIPPNSSVAFPLGAQIAIEQGGTGTVTIAAGAGVTIQGVTNTSGQYSLVALIKQATNTWFIASAGGTSGYSGYCGLSGYSGFCGLSGYSGFCGLSGYSGFCGISGYSGFCGLSGYSGYSGSGISGYSGYSGPSLLVFSTQTDTDYTLALTDLNTGVNMSSSSAHTLTVPPNSSVAFPLGAQIVVEQGGTASVTIAPGSGVTLNGTLATAGQYSLVVLLKQATDTWLVSSGNSGYSGFSGASGSSGFSGFSGQPQLTKITFIEGDNLDEAANVVVSKAGTITGTAGVGSSLFLQRLIIPAAMSITEIDIALSIGFPVTSQGAGTLSRSMVIYSLGNSTSLASIMSKSGSSVWSTGTGPTAGAASLTQFQGGWSSPLIQPMTFAASSLAAGEYVIGQLFDFAQASSTWTLNFYGVAAVSTFLASAATNLTSATLGAMSSGGLSAASGITGISSYASSIIPMQWSGENSASGITGFTLSPQAVTGTIASGLTASVLLSGSGTIKSSATLWSLIGASSNSNLLSSVGTRAGSIFTGSTSIGAVTNVGMAALASSTLAQITLPNFGFIGNGSTTSNFPTVFIEGIMSTGGVPAAITLTSTAVTYSGSAAFQQPWFALCGS